MINDPCERCAAAYGHEGACPTIIKDASRKTKAEGDWQRGKSDAEQHANASTRDAANANYMLGRKYQELEAKGLVPKRRRRSIRVAIQSEPRLAAVISIARTDS